MVRLVLGFVLAALLIGSSFSAEQRLKVVTTFAPAYSLAAAIVGEHADVQNLLPANASLHEYTLSPRDVQKLTSAQLLVMNGAGLETWLGKALKSVESRPGVRIVKLAEHLETSLIHNDSAHAHAHGHDHAHDHGHYNPHLWLDPVLMMQAVTNLTQGLIAADPANQAHYRRNSIHILEKLQLLHADFQEQTREIQKVAFLTYHNAFAYLAKRYSLNLAGVVEEIPEISPSPRELKALHARIKEKQVKVLFVEPGFRMRLANQIGRDAKIKVAELDPFETGELSAGAYEKVMRRNLESLLESLKP